MMTYMASKPKIFQGTAGGGGWGLGPQTMEQSWQLHGPVISSTDSLQPLVAFLMGSILRIGRSTRRNHAELGAHETMFSVLCLIILTHWEAHRNRVAQLGTKNGRTTVLSFARLWGWDAGQAGSFATGFGVPPLVLC